MQKNNLPDVIYAIRGVTNRFDGVWDDYQWPDQSGTEYTNSRIVEALKAENEELKAKLDKAKDGLYFYMDIGLYEGVSLGVAPINDDRGKRARTTLEEVEDDTV